MYYTYAHSIPNVGVFYIGKGTGDRVFSRGDRSYLWRDVVYKAEAVTMQVLAHWKTEEEAYEHEQFLISCFKDMGAKLVNQTDGGLGPNGAMQDPEVVAKRSLKLVGYKHKMITCPNCGKTGGGTSMHKWHFDRCTGGHKAFKARVTVDGKRIHLGVFATEEEATKVMIDYYASVGKPLPKEFKRHRGIK